LAIQIAVAHDGLFHLRPDRLRTPGGHEVLDGAVNETAPFTPLGQASQQTDSMLGENNVEPPIHGPIHILYT
jgi:hypothetical protein